MTWSLARGQDGEPPLHQHVTHMRLQLLANDKNPTIQSTSIGQNHVPAYIFVSFEKPFHSYAHHNKEEKTITASKYRPLQTKEDIYNYKVVLIILILYE